MPDPLKGFTPQAIAWDLDGTILDSFNIYMAVNRDVAQTLGLDEPSEELARKNYHGLLGDSIKAAYGEAFGDTDIDEYIKHFLEKQSDHFIEAEQHLLKDAVRLSAQAAAKGIPQVIVTNRDHEGRGHGSPRSIVSNTSLVDHIDEIICGDEGKGFRKPDPAVLGDLLDRWKVDPAKLLVIGDQHVDAQFALNLNAKAVIVCRDGPEFMHSHLLDDGWQDHVAVVASLDEVKL